MKYNSLLATDMDYTLLMPGQDVSPENVRAVKALRANGVAFTLATGRSSYLVGKYAQDLEIDIPIITGNGGALYDPVTKRDLMSKDFTEEKFRSLMTSMLERKIDATIYSVSGIYFSPYSTRRAFCEDYNAAMTEENKIPLKGFDGNDLAKDVIPSFNKFLLIGPPEDFVEELKADGNLTVVSSAPEFYDVMTADVSKGDAMLELADYLGIPRKNTFASGDSENDITLLESAACGIAMADSDAKVISAAAFVTSTCEEDGFARAVFDFVIPKVKSFT
ncbi:MAG: Cof-type HAD-IIB family hydrolase [Saccharofermentans sp.]|nr:Cof-type HAD-IIB family hydrolase [Saccharofermentans sp.]